MCRLQTPQLEEALNGFPLYSQDGKGKEAICRAIFAIGSARWFILEGEREGDDTILFGIVIGLLDDEYGYVSLKELAGVELDLTAQGYAGEWLEISGDLSPSRYFQAVTDMDDIRTRAWLLALNLSEIAEGGDKLLNFPWYRWN